MILKDFVRHLFFIMLAAVLALLTGSQAMAEQIVTASVDEQAPLCRFGVNVSRRDRNIAGVTDFDTTTLRIGWYIDYQAKRTPAKPNGADFVQLVSMRNDKLSLSPSEIATIAQMNPGAKWFGGNEPDRRDDQDDVVPERYAEMYHDLYHQIKQHDPTARVIPGSIVQGTEVRLKYLDRILAHYRSLYGTQMPADGWSLHGFVLNEVNPENNPDNLETWGAEIPPGLNDSTGLVIHDAVEKTVDLDLFTQNIERFRTWMANNGYRETPLYLSEFGVLIPAYPGYEEYFGEGSVNAYMDQTFAYLLTKTDSRTGYAADGNRLVQRLSWFSTYDPIYNGDLFTSDGKQMTLIGQNYARYTQKLDIETDFYPLSLFTRPLGLMSDGQKVDLTLEAAIANSGNNQDPKSVSVHFYNGDPTSGGTLIGTDVVNMGGCGETATATLQWTNVSPKEYELFAVTEATDGDAESDADNNTRSYRLLYNPDQAFLPMIAR